MRLAGEPSVDEILSSIKKVIARDDRAVAPRPALARDGVAAPAGHDDDDHDDDVLDLADAASFREPAPGPGPGTSTGDAAPLLTTASQAAMRESLATLAMLAESPASPPIVRSGETSLEALTRDLLRPALAEWLDRHLPAMVEKLVAREIARIVGK